MEYKHISVLYEECIEGLNIKEDGVYLDGTLGGAGHALGVCSKLSKEGTFIGVDRDRDALNVAEPKLADCACKKHLVQANYSEVKAVLENLGIDGLDGALLDLGVSSFQLDNQDRGFSYMQDAPLDMRMNAGDLLTAETVVNKYTEKELTKIIKDYGEEKWASRIAKFIVEARKEKPIISTGELVEIIKAAIPAKARREGPHPAKRTFQAIRIEVNEELGHLQNAVKDFCDVLNPGGRLCIISFHSLEDRIVKEYFNDRLNPCTCPKEFPICVCKKKTDMIKVTGKPILPSDEEIEANPRSRSAKLRIIEKKR